ATLSTLPAHHGPRVPSPPGAASRGRPYHGTHAVRRHSTCGFASLAGRPSRSMARSDLVPHLFDPRAAGHNFSWLGNALGSRFAVGITGLAGWLVRGDFGARISPSCGRRSALYPPLATTEAS